MDIDIGSIGGTLYLVDKSFSSVLGAAQGAVDKTGKAVDGFAARLNNASQEIANTAKEMAKLGSDPSAVNQLTAASNALGFLGKAAGPIGVILQGVVGSLAAVGAVAVTAVGIVTALTIKAANLGDELLTMSKQTGVSVESLSFFRYAADQTGVSLSTISTGVSKFTADLGKGSKSFKDSVADLGLSIGSLRNMEPEKAFTAVLDALGKIPNKADQAAVGTRLFGTNFRKMSALIGEDLAGMEKDFDSWGGKVSTEAAVAGDMMNDALGRIGRMLEAVGNSIGNIFVPIAAAAFKEIGDAWVKARQRVGTTSADFIEIFDKVGTFLIEWAALGIQSIAMIADKLAEFFEGRWIGQLKIVEYIATVGEALVRLQAATMNSAEDVKAGMAMADRFKQLAEFASGAEVGVSKVAGAIRDTSAVVRAFGEELGKTASGAIANMRKSISETAEETRKANGAFQGLGEVADKEAEKARKAWNKFLTEIGINFRKQWEAIVKVTDAEMKEVGKAWLSMQKDQEDADRTMRRVTQTTTQFTIGEINKRLEQRKKEIEVLKLVGVSEDLAVKMTVAAQNKAQAEIFETVVQTKEFEKAWLQAAVMIGGPIGNAAIARIAELSEEFGNATDSAKEFRQNVVDVMQDVGDIIRDTIKNGGSIGDVFIGVTKLAGNKISSTISSTISKGIADGTISGVTAVAGMGATIGLQIALDYWTKAWDEIRNAPAAKAAGENAAAQFAAGFGGNKGLRRAARMAGIDSIDISHVISPSSPENFQDALNRVSPALQDFQNKIKALGQAAQGADVLVQGLALNFGKSMDKQIEAQKAKDKAVIDSMKLAGESSDKIAAMETMQAEALKNKTFEATEEQIKAFSRAGTIIGGVIANTVNQTGDLVGAIMASADAIQRLVDIRDKFNLSDEQMGAATTQVIKLYETIKNNEDVFTSIAGIGQVMTGLGDAIVANSELANAFGQELAADFQTLKDRGVDVGTIWASMAPQLQKLWELQKDGRITVDETTQALLDQAEAAGVVGETQRDVNERILDVLTEIRDLIGYVGNVALPRMGTAADNAGRATQRSLDGVASAGRSASNAVRDVNDKLGGIKQPPPITIDVDFDVEDVDWSKYGPAGGDWNWKNGRPQEQQRPPGFANGSGGFRDFGDGTPAVLHGLERVQTYSDYMDERSGGTSTIVVEIDGQAVVAANARNKDRWTKIRAGSSPRTIR